MGQTTVRPPPPRKTKIQGNQVQPKVVKKVCWIGGGRSALTCKQVRRKLIGEDGNAQTGRRRIQSLRQKSGAKPAEKKQKSRMLLHVDPQNENELEKEFSSLDVKPSAEDLTFLISQQITQSIR